MRMRRIDYDWDAMLTLYLNGYTTVDLYWITGAVPGYISKKFRYHADRFKEYNARDKFVKSKKVLDMNDPKIKLALQRLDQVVLIPASENQKQVTMLDTYKFYYKHVLYYTDYVVRYVNNYVNKLLSQDKISSQDLVDLYKVLDKYICSSLGIKATDMIMSDGKPFVISRKENSAHRKSKIKKMAKRLSLYERKLTTSKRRQAELELKKIHYVARNRVRA